MNKVRTYITIFSVIALLVGGLYYFLRDEPLTPEETAKQVQSEQPNIQLSGNKIVEEQDGKVKWELSAGNIEFDNKTKQVYLIDIKGVFYRDNGEKLEVLAPKAVMDTKMRDLMMTGGVKAEAGNGSVLTANELKWLAKQEHILGSGNVKLNRDDIMIVGDVIESDTGLEKVKVKGNARVIRGGERP